MRAEGSERDALVPELLEAGHELIAAERKILRSETLPSLAGIAGPHTVMTKGSFDLLHAGHLSLFQAAGRMATSHPDGRLLVCVESDASVRRRKGALRPVNDESARALQIALLPQVNFVVTCDYRELATIVAVITPWAFLMGQDTTRLAKNAAGHDVLIPTTEQVDLFAALTSSCSRVIVFRDDGTFSSTRVIERILALATRG
jgi:D-beta-D-heptose 7-phosphate kinase/D-beta-D-heptose 1-phosphate adenosyltransferase